MSSVRIYLRDPMNAGLARWRVLVKINKWTPPRKSGGILSLSTRFSLSMDMSRLTRDALVEPVSRDEILRRERGQEYINFPCSRIGNLTRLILTLLLYV